MNSRLRNRWVNLEKLLQETIVVNVVWYIFPLIAIAIKAIQAPCNNYLIYKGVFYHTLQKTNLFDFYPSEYVDKNHYGILFSLIIAPFTFLPDIVAILVYQALQLFALNFIIRKLPLSIFKQNLLLCFLLVDAIGNCQNMQTNTFIAFVMLGSFVWIYKQEEAKAAFLTMAGFFIKLYGIVGIGLFFFSKRKPKYILFIFLSSILFYVLPLLITNWTFLQQSYIDWFIELKSKNGTNNDLTNMHQNLSFIGFVVRTTQINTFNLLYIVGSAFTLQLLPLMRWNLFQNSTFQMRYLATLMMFIILFNTATEASTYIIGATGAGIWWLNHTDYKSKRMLFFMCFVFFLGTLSTTDLVPHYFNFEIVRKYGLKSLPYFIVWCLCIYQLILGKFPLNQKTIC